MLRVTTPMGFTWIIIEDRDERLLSYPVNVNGAPICSKRKEVTAASAELLTGLHMPAAMDRLRELVQESRGSK